MHRFVENLQKKREEREHGELKVHELEKAENLIVKLIQLDSFSSEHGKKLKSISVFKDERGILRVKTKLTERKDLENFKYPILLPSKHKLVKLLILYIERHWFLHHAGLHLLLTNLREKFWIINGRKTIISAISNCIVCKRHSTRAKGTISVSLPEDRIKETSIFDVVGIDLAGLLILKGGTKAWFSLYTCAVFRASHLELLTSLSTNCFLLSLRRCIARRGRPQVIYSDNGTNFTGAINLLKLYWKMIESEAVNRRITWKFNPPSACWWGGFWEHLIQSVKKILRRVLKNASLPYEEILSLLCKCKAIVNSRPLTYVLEDSDELQPITPCNV
ncbi:integrase catalytic domain-containing protein [Trichonephila clavipes]|uniref:Integrase catalytic domain-containing protein n=1 Tax=Trichonephila clavipes TaxID=2585209 RepID=A0A8X7BLG1_TRICX|nr:integrase catalytic domain-containing protein [Trichonephila clavipes]